jgi:hydrogenase maturation protease
VNASELKVVVLGVGNLLMSDEGVGVHTLAAFEKDFSVPDNVRLVDGGTSTNELLGDLEDLDHLIVVDAVSAGLAPGGLVRLEGSAVPAAFTTKLSPHQVGISDLLATLTFMGRAPKNVVLLGVEPLRLTLDMTLSPTVAARVPELCAQLVVELQKIGLASTRLN